MNGSLTAERSVNPTEFPEEATLETDASRNFAESTLPDPDANPNRPVVLFDGHCRFCQASVRQLQRLDRRGKHLSFLSMHDPRVQQRYPDLTHEQLMREMVIVEPGGARHAGSDAVRFLSRRLPALWLAAPILHLPGTAGLWRSLYAWVARNRYRIAGRQCDSGSCQIH
ncbi:MAG: DUF393 domain-containing protein [Planctomycetota bacterium]